MTRREWALAIVGGMLGAAALYLYFLAFLCLGVALGF